LLSRVSHELRTRWAGFGYAELLQYKALATLNDNQQCAVDNIIEYALPYGCRHRPVDEAQMNPNPQSLQ
jgi:hypothetical protein